MRFLWKWYLLPLLVLVLEVLVLLSFELGPNLLEFLLDVAIIVAFILVALRYIFGSFQKDSDLEPIKGD